jgi:hypothetical protein
VSRDSRTIAENSGWSVGQDPATIEAASKQVSAFDLARGSADAVLLLSLQPGSYTAQLTPNNVADGVGLIEVYEVDP